MLPFRNEMEKSLAELKSSETLALPGSHVFHPQNYVIRAPGWLRGLSICPLLGA